MLFAIIQEQNDATFMYFTCFVTNAFLYRLLFLALDSVTWMGHPKLRF